jgi:hypothetical protein
MTYQPTQIDQRKAQADILIQAAERNGYSITSRVHLFGRGIKSYGNGNYSVTDGALAKLRAAHVVECDF